jgi:hypothetical protein
MPITIDEHALSRRHTNTEDGYSSTLELKFFVFEEADDAAADAAAASFLPAIYGGKHLQSYTLDPKGAGFWDGTALYGWKKPKEKVFNFRTTGGTQHITQSLQTIETASTGDSGAPDCEGVIGVNGDTIAGTDITVPVYAFEETHYVPLAYMTLAYRLILFAMTAKTNSAPWREFNEQECRFLGVTGSQRGIDDWELTFHFDGSPTVTDLPVGPDMTISEKKGWEYFWVLYQDKADASCLVKKPRAAYVEKVYRTADFKLLGLDPPEVTIEQGSTQVDPAGSSPVLFDVVFDQVVTGFTTAGIDLSGTASSTTPALSLSGSGAVYVLSVDNLHGGMGQVVAAVKANAAVSILGVGNNPSTSTDNLVVYNIP